MVHIAVIGAGCAGLCAAKTALQSGCEVTVFEQAKQVGGTWVYSDQIGKDEYGLDVHTSMYQGLHTNLPKELMGYPDFPIPDQKKSYIPQKDMLTFLELYAQQFDVYKTIKFQSYVIRVRPYGDEDQWEIIVRDLPTETYTTYIFDAIIVCNGHYHTPAMPKYPGKDVYKGQQIHSHDFRCSQPFKGASVLVIGAGPSGMDLANEMSKVAERVTLSHHQNPEPKTIFRPNVDMRPDVERLTENGVVFVDGTEQTYSVIMYCTGYKYTFPFLSIDCGISVDDNYVKPLYKHCININHPTMALIGVPFYVCASQMFDLQVRFVMKYFSKQLQLPSKKEMLKDTQDEMEKRWALGLKKRQAHMMGPAQNDYYDDLAKTAGIDNLKPVMTKLHNDSSERFLDDLVNFRKDIYRIIDDETFIKIKGV
ncbi:uncharacterized protein LOC129574582 [Sitodiplosis mosellana]|uniref:uncharacterized protein LOC129574582 n=1 Tax=Sitodiplosis mosellana TaxID=263140 RepID=UPI002443C25E|nr:uncharacterized protein LOC129574582 [Sitodiplosis mosellana]